MSSTREGCFEIPSVYLAMHFARLQREDASRKPPRWADWNLTATVYPIPYAIKEEPRA